MSALKMKMSVDSCDMGLRLGLSIYLLYETSQVRCACDRVIQSGDCWTQNEGFVIQPVTNVVRDGLDHKSRVLCTDNLHVGSKTITMHQHEGCFDCILIWVVLLQTL